MRNSVRTELNAARPFPNKLFIQFAITTDIRGVPVRTLALQYRIESLTDIVVRLEVI